MPFVTGTARTPSELLNAINTLLTANGWTRLRGETDMNCAAPKAARYWRFVSFETQTTSNATVGIQKLHLRTTIGGANVATNAANWSFNSIGTGGGSALIAGGTPTRSGHGSNSGVWILTYDFESATTIREIEIQADSTVGNTPRDIAVQWSNDGECWTTIFEVAATTWTAGQTRQYSWADGSLFSRHVANNAPRRSGSRESWSEFLTLWTLTTPNRSMSNDTWIWQGPGYDASRRVYIHMRGFCREASDTHGIEFSFATAHNAAIFGFANQSGSPNARRSIIFNSSTINYWLYCNSKRIIIVVRSGAQDYTSAYIGFTSAFATPDQWAFPLCAVATMENETIHNYGDSNARLSFCADPGLNGGVLRLWDGTEQSIGNRPNSASSDMYLETPQCWISPFHFGSANSVDAWPAAHVGDSNDYLGHMLDRIDPSVQGHLPLFPCTIQQNVYGNLGVLDGVFGIQGGGVLTALQLVAISGQNYRIFPNRTRRNGVNWMAVRED